MWIGRSLSRERCDRRHVGAGVGAVRGGAASGRFACRSRSGISYCGNIDFVRLQIPNAKE